MSSKIRYTECRKRLYLTILIHWLDYKVLNISRRNMNKKQLLNMLTFFYDHLKTEIASELLVAIMHIIIEKELKYKSQTKKVKL